MTIHAGEMLLRRVRPIIRAALARGSVRPVGAEDLEELEQDGMAQAAAMLEAAEQAGKEVCPNSVAFYTLKALRSGRRSGCANRTDVMSPATQLDGRSVMLSMDEPLDVFDADDEDEFNLHQSLASTGEDPAQAGARELDWDGATGALDDRELRILGATATGLQGTELARACNVSPPRITQLKRAIGDKIRYVLGNDALAACVCEPVWQAGLRAARERRACRYA